MSERLQLRSPYAMAYILEFENGEKLIRQFRVKLSIEAKPFHFAVSDRALYWPEKSLVNWDDPSYFRRIPHNQVQAVSLKKLAPYAIWFLAALMVVGGFVTGFLLLVPFLERETSRRFALPHISAFLPRSLTFLTIALIVGGIYLPSIARARFGLRIQTPDKSFTWKPPLLFDKPSRIHIAIALKDMLNSCQQAGLRVLDGHQR